MSWLKGWGRQKTRKPKEVDLMSEEDMASSVKRSVGRSYLTYAYDEKGTPTLVTGKGTVCRWGNIMAENMSNKDMLRHLRKQGVAISATLKKALERGEI